MSALSDSPRKVPKSKIIFEGKNRTVVKVEYKNRSYEVSRSQDSVKILALRNDNRIALVKQARPGCELSTVEIPGGAIELDEEPLDAGQRELREETGLTARRWDLLCSQLLNSPGQSNERTFLFLARDLQIGPHEREDSEVEMQQYWLPVEEYEKGFYSGDYSDMASFTAVSSYLRKHQ